MVNVPDNVRLRFEDDVATVNGALNPTVHDHALGRDTTSDLGTWRDNERSAV
jgi:hypothetical protein